MIAFLSPGVPSTAVYLVNPSSMALIAACLMCAGVSTEADHILALRLKLACPVCEGFDARNALGKHDR